MEAAEAAPPGTDSSQHEATTLTFPMAAALMAFPMKSALMALALLCLSVARVGAAQLPSAGTTDSLGLNVHFTWPPDRDMQMIQAAGAKVVRVDCLWHLAESTKGAYDFTRWDALTNACAARGIRTFYQLDYNNSMYGTVGSAEWNQGYANYAAAAVAHFKGKGVMWEMYNEPNTTFWPGGSNVGQYMAMVNRAVPAMCAADPGCTIIGPALSGVADGPTDFFTTCCQQGLLNLVDAVSIHPYRWSPAVENPETLVPAYASIKSLISTYHPSGSIPIVSSEFRVSHHRCYASNTGRLPGPQFLDQPQPRHSNLDWVRLEGRRQRHDQSRGQFWNCEDRLHAETSV